MSWIMSQNSRRALASTPAVGSSSSSSFGSMQDAGGKRQPLLPTAGELSGELVAAVGEPHALHDVRDRRAAIRHLVDAGDEIEVLEDRQVFVEAEFLRHVADLRGGSAAPRG